jgi:predicted permease
MFELRLSFRRLIRRPWSTAVTTAVLAVGLALSSAAISPLWHTAVIAVPVPQPGRLVSLFEVSAPRGWADAPVSPANYRDWGRRSRALASMTFHASGAQRGGEARERIVTGPNGVELQPILAVAGNFFDVLRQSPSHGRSFEDADALPGAAPVVVLSDTLARRLSADRASAVGKTLEIDGVNHAIRGVMPASFWFPSTRVAAWVPLQLPASDFETRRQARVLRVLARLADGATIEQARADVGRVAAELAVEFPRTNGDTQIGIESWSRWSAGPRREPYRLAAACGSLLLLIAIVNAALMATTSLENRRREWLIARALGADRSRLALGVLLDTGLLTAFAAGLAWPAARLLLWVAGTAFANQLGPVEEFDVRALLVMAAATAVGLAAGIAIAAGRMLISALPLASASRGSLEHRTHGRWANAAQIGTAFVLACGAVALVRGFQSLAAVPSGIRLDGKLAATVTLRTPRFRDESQIGRYFQEALTRLRGLPGVTHAGATSVLPLNGAGWTAFAWMPDLPDVANVEVRQREITAGYVEAAGLPLIEGRSFTADDSAAAPAAVVNAAFVREICRGRSPVGLRLSFAAPDRSPRWWQIVGVVGDERFTPRDDHLVPLVYRIHDATPEETMTIVVGSDGGRLALAAPVRRVLREVDPEAIVLQVEPLDAAVGRSVERERAVSRLAAVAAMTSLLLAAAGLYGVMALDVRRRERELAVRVALGARSSQIRGAVWHRAFIALTAGLAAGGFVVWVARGWFAAIVDFARLDGWTIVVAAAMTVVVCIASMYPSVFRALRIDPATLLRI